jgi:hypothetical protein
MMATSNPSENELLTEYGAHAWSLSTLVWKGDPKVFEAGDEDQKLGMYLSPRSECRLHLEGWSEEHNALSYAPANNEDYNVVYSRAQYIGLLGSTFTYEGNILNQDRCPLFFLHQQGTSAFADLRIKTPEDDHDSDPVPRVRQKVPPFEFIVSDEPEPFAIEGIFSSLDYVTIVEPDLPGQTATIEYDSDGTESDPSDSDVEIDGQRLTGWGGKWARELLQLSEAGLPMTSLRRIIWSGFEEKKWGIEFILDVSWSSYLYCDAFLNIPSFQPVPGSIVKADPQDFDLAEPLRKWKPTIRSYEIKATVVQIFVKPEYVMQLKGLSKISKEPDNSEDHGEGPSKRPLDAGDEKETAKRTRVV